MSNDAITRRRVARAIRAAKRAIDLQRRMNREKLNVVIRWYKKLSRWASFSKDIRGI